MSDDALTERAQVVAAHRFNISNAVGLSYAASFGYRSHEGVAWIGLRQSQIGCGAYRREKNWFAWAEPHLVAAPDWMLVIAAPGPGAFQP